MRLIDADALIKETTEARCVNCDRRKGMKKGKTTFVYEIGEVPCRACDVMDMIDTLDEAPTIGGWISVKDRLPKDETEVIIIVQHKIGWYRAFAWHDEYGWHSSAEEFGDGESDFVTHWMPLPEPPEEVSGDEG